MAVALGLESSVDYIIANDCGGFVEHHLGYRYGFVGLFGGTQTQIRRDERTRLNVLRFHGNVSHKPQIEAMCQHGT